MKSNYFIGLMSGTSLDGIDGVLADFSSHIPKIIATHSEQLPPELHAGLLALIQQQETSLKLLGECDAALGEHYAAICLALIKKSGLSAKDIAAIGSHGQTICHHPNGAFPFTLQIGDANRIAAKTRVTTINDFRRRDIALGGQGAPLVPAFHQAVFQNAHENRIILNIGGIANITVLSKDLTQPIIGFDTGPGNTLLDGWIHKTHQQPYDENGEWAASGKINQALLEKLLADHYFSKKPPKSTGREHFNLAWLEQHLGKHCIAEDVQATLVELTAITIIDAIKHYAPETEKIFVCGGGAYNTYLMQRLQNLGNKFIISTTKTLGIDPQWIEALAFAWLAKQTLNHLPGNLTSVTGAREETILGGVYY